MSSSLPARGTLHRKYVQLMTPALSGVVTPSQTALYNESLDGNTKTGITLPDGVTGAVTDPRFLGPVILAKKDRPVRVTFYNLLPTGSGGDMPLPTDSTLMGAGFVPEGWRDLTDTASVDDEVRNPPCTLETKGARSQLLQGQPGHPAPARRHQPLDQRRHAAPVDHPRPAKTRPIPRATASGNVPDMIGTPEPCHWRAGLLGARRRLPDLLLDQPAVRAADVLPRPCLRDDASQRLSGRGRRLPDLRRDRGQARSPAGPSRSTRSRSSSRTGPSCPTRTSSPWPTPPGTTTAGAATATSGTTTSTCRPRTRATPRA